MPKKRGVAKPRKSSAVPGQFYGYSLQITRAVAHLLRAGEGAAISIECLDDVATVAGSGQAVAEQAKSGLAHNPVTDRSIELWKTLHNWVEAVRSGALTLNTTFVLYVAQQHKGRIVQRIHDAETADEARALIRDLRAEFWGAAPKFSKKKALPAALAEHVNGVLEASEPVLVALFRNIVVERGSGAPNDDLLAPIKTLAVSERAREPVLASLLGWVKRRIDQQIENGRAAVIAYDDFHRQLVGSARKHDRADAVLQSAASQPDPDEIKKEMRSRTYVRQLQFVEAKIDDQTQAVTEYLMSFVDRTNWAEQGDVQAASFEDFERHLVGVWTNHRRGIEVEMKARPAKDRGLVLFSRCCGQTGLTLQGMTLPAHFTPGSFHMLADEPKLGWHPNYAQFLSGGTTEKQRSDHGNSGKRPKQRGRRKVRTGQ